MHEARLIGLTGGIGTGKSKVSAMLRKLGAAVVDADEGARAVVEPGTPGLRAVAEEFGPGVVGPDGRLDRAALAEIVFKDPERRARLNAITHPLVGAWAAERTAEAVGRGARIVVHDIPLLFENQRQGQFERVILVYAADEVAVSRLLRKGMTEEQARARIAAQMPIEEKRRLADHVVDNSDGLPATERQVRELWQRLTNPFDGLRDQALKARLQAPAGGRVFGGLMDWSLNGGLATLFALADGTASLYLSGGGGVIGGSAHLAVREAARRFLLTLEQLLPQMSADPSGEKPPPGMTDLRALTPDGRYVARVATELLGRGLHPMAAAFHAGQAVIAELRKVAEASQPPG